VGELYEVLDQVSQRALGLKLWWKSPSASSTGNSCLVDEMARVRRIVHPNVCRSYGFGEHERPGLGRVCFVTEELVPGPTPQAKSSARNAAVWRGPRRARGLASASGST
jgi:hypothetical protein